MTTLARVCRFLPPIVDLDYPADLLAARRAEFVERIREANEVDTPRLVDAETNNTRYTKENK